MKKSIFTILLCLMMASSAYSNAPLVDGRTDASAKSRPWMVLKRGLLNGFGLPVEFPRTFIAEKEIHPIIWPATAIPRSFNNFFVRAASAAHDIFFFPWYAAYTDDLSPLSEPMGIPEYPWTKE